MFPDKILDEIFEMNSVCEIGMLSPAAGCTRHRLGNTSTCPYYAFRHITRYAADDDFVMCRNT